MKNNKQKIIGITGFARSGKDTFYNQCSKLLEHKNTYRYAFADALKEECDNFLLDNLNISSFTEESFEKELIRPFLVTYGTHIRRKLDPNCWIKKVQKKIELNHANSSDFIFITDVRFKNEAEWIKSLGGLLVQINREDFGPANQEEKDQSALIKPFIDYNISWPTFNEHIEKANKFIKPFIEKNFRTNS